MLAGAEGDTQAGSRIRVRNNSATTDAFLGGADVTTATGYKIAVGEQVPLDLDTGEALSSGGHGRDGPADGAARRGVIRVTLRSREATKEHPSQESR